MKLYYKYLPKERLTYLEDELIRFTQPTDLNDPFECLPTKPTETELQKGLSEIRLPNETSVAQKLIEDRNNLYPSFFHEIGILSLSEKWNSSLMWSHYSISHKGFCIGFNPKDDFFKDYFSTDHRKAKMTRKVVYTNKRVQVPVALGQRNLELRPFITKSFDWEYEHEIRVLASLNLNDQIIPKEPINIHLFKLPHRAIKEIIAGVNIDIEGEKQIKAFCDKNNISFFKSKISDKNFDMERE